MARWNCREMVLIIVMLLKSYISVLNNCILFHYPGAIIYEGRNKFKNEELHNYAFPEDIWFYVDNFSSASSLRMD